MIMLTKRQAEPIILTNLQAEAIIHRLDVPDALWDVFKDTFDESQGIPTKVFKPYFYDMCELLVDKVRSRKVSNLDVWQIWVLVECIEGSTLVAVAEHQVWLGEKPAQYISQTINMLRRIANKFARLQDDPIIVPTY